MGSDSSVERQSKADYYMVEIDRAIKEGNIELFLKMPYRDGSRRYPVDVENRINEMMARMFEGRYIYCWAEHECDGSYNFERWVNSFGMKRGELKKPTRDVESAMEYLRYLEERRWSMSREIIKGGKYGEYRSGWKVILKHSNYPEIIQEDSEFPYALTMAMLHAGRNLWLERKFYWMKDFMSTENKRLLKQTLPDLEKLVA